MSLLYFVFTDKQVKELRKLIAGTSHLPLNSMRLVCRGNVLHDSTDGDDLFVQLQDGGMNILSSFSCQHLHTWMYVSLFLMISYVMFYFLFSNMVMHHIVEIQSTTALKYNIGNHILHGADAHSNNVLQFGLTVLFQNLSPGWLYLD